MTKKQQSPRSVTQVRGRVSRPPATVPRPQRRVFQSLESCWKISLGASEVSVTAEWPRRSRKKWRRQTRSGLGPRWSARVSSVEVHYCPPYAANSNEITGRLGDVNRRRDSAHERRRLSGYSADRAQQGSTTNTAHHNVTPTKQSITQDIQRQSNK